MSMSVRELRDTLDALMKADTVTSERIVTFGPDMTFIEGGIIKGGALCLTPIKLDQVGGF